jgi:hypothetical protein
MQRFGGSDGLLKALEQMSLMVRGQATVMSFRRVAHADRAVFCARRVRLRHEAATTAAAHKAELLSARD